MKKVTANQIPGLILRLGMGCTAAMAAVFAALQYPGWYIATLERQLLAAGLTKLMPEYALLSLTIAIAGAALTDVYRKRMM